MFKPISFCIGLRYTRAKRRQRFISFISIMSMLGIAVGITVLITVLSVMNGFDEVIHEQIFTMARQINVTSVSGRVNNWAWLEKKLSGYPHVNAVAPYLNINGMLSHAGFTKPTLAIGIDPIKEEKINALSDKMIEGSVSDLKAGEYYVLIGKNLANRLGAQVGDKVLLLTPNYSISIAGISARMKHFTIAGIFKIGNGMNYDGHVIYIHLKDAQVLEKMGDQVSGLAIKVDHLYQAPHVASDIQKTLDAGYYISDWTRDYGELFGVLKLEKTMMFLLLAFLIVVAVFNLVSSLVMAVNDKRADIAILRSMGATPAMITRIFMVQGCVIGAVGTLFGLIGGILLSWNVTAIVQSIEAYWGVQFLSSDFYWVNYLPSKLQSTDVIEVCSLALLLSFLSTIGPAWSAAKQQPVEALRYE